MGEEQENEEIVKFIADRLYEIGRLSMTMAASTELSDQTAIDQLDRLKQSVESVLFYTQFFGDNPLNRPVLRKIAVNWSYHPDFNKNWDTGQVTESL